MTNEEFFKEIFDKIKSGEITQNMFDVFLEMEKQKSFTDGSKSGFHQGYKEATKFLKESND